MPDCGIHARSNAASGNFRPETRIGTNFGNGRRKQFAAAFAGTLRFAFLREIPVIKRRPRKQSVDLEEFPERAPKLPPRQVFGINFGNSSDRD
jgi:hypothetical protein